MPQKSRLKEIDIKICKTMIELHKLKIKKSEEILKLLEKGLSYGQIGKKLGVSRQCVHQRVNPRFKTLEKKPLKNYMREQRENLST